MFFSLYNEPALFQKYINDIFWKYLNKFYTVYLNDILIYNDNKIKYKIYVKYVF